jgi:hypothetical protein
MSVIISTVYVYKEAAGHPFNPEALYHHVYSYRYFSQILDATEIHKHQFSIIYMYLQLQDYRLNRK